MKQNNYKVAVYVKRATLTIDKLANSLLAPYRLTNSQYKVLKYIFENQDQPIRNAEIEKHFYMTNPTATGVIQNLEKRGLILRRENPEDRRSKLLVPTEYAYSIKAELYRVGEAIEAQVTEKLTDGEREELIRLLVKMLGRE